MNTISKTVTVFLHQIRLFLLALSFVFLACLQGPWDYVPTKPSIYSGLWITGYLVADRPVENFCVEKMLSLQDAHTSAFPFYDSASITISGNFSNRDTSLQLVPVDSMPNCFSGDPSLLLVRGAVYQLAGEIAWDSLGTKVKTTFSSVTHIPEKFSISKTADAPAITVSGISFDIGALDSTTLNQFSQLPDYIRVPFLQEYRDTLVSLFQSGDSVAISEFFRKNAKIMNDRLVELAEGSRIVYNEGDSLFYLTGAFNTLSHRYHSDRDTSVKGVLITHRFDPQEGRPETRFDNFLGQVPDTSNYYFPGSLRRLIFYPEFKDEKGYSILDSLGVVNTWFHAGLNRLYFYGVAREYQQYVNNTIESEGDVRIPAFYNIKGAAGIFTGAVIDSFDIFIKTTPTTKVFPLPVAHAAKCKEEGWFKSQDCRNYYPIYCKSTGWTEEFCKQSALQFCYESGWQDTLARSSADSTVPDSILQQSKTSVCSEVAPAFLSDSLTVSLSRQRFCVSHNFPVTFSSQASETSSCAKELEFCRSADTKKKSCRETLWNYCLDTQWKPAQCSWAMVSYCKLNKRPSEVLCRVADRFCAANPSETLCQ